MLRLPSASLDPFETFSCYNSPYVAHDDACAIDLYPGGVDAPSPVAGEVVTVERVRAPWTPHARAYDYVVAIDTGAGDRPLPLEGSGDAAVARLLHLDPAVDVGDVVGVGDRLGGLLRAGFFAPWVSNHLHVGFRVPGADRRRADGSVPLALDVEVAPLGWDGAGTVAAAGRTFVELETPLAGDGGSPAWVGLGTDEGHVLDGGLPHYPSGGLVDGLVGGRRSAGGDRQVRLLGAVIGTADGPTVTWDDVGVEANGRAVTGLSLFCARPDRFTVKLVCPDHPFEPGDEVTVSIDERSG